MAEEIDFENGQISNLKGLVTLTLVRVILHTVVHHSSTSTYIPNFIEIKETPCGRTYANLRPALLGRLCRRVHLIMHIHKPSASTATLTTAGPTVGTFYFHAAGSQYMP